MAIFLSQLLKQFMEMVLFVRSSPKPILNRFRGICLIQVPASLLPIHSNVSGNKQRSMWHQALLRTRPEIRA